MVCVKEMFLCLIRIAVCVQPQGVLKELNTSFAAAILRDSPETNQMTTKRKEGRFGWKKGSDLFRRMSRAGFASLLGIINPPALVPSSSPPRPVLTLTPETVLSTHPGSESTPSSRVLSSSKSINGLSAHDTAQHANEMATLSPKHSAVTPERMRSQGSTSSLRRRVDGDHPPMSSGSIPLSQEMPSHIYRRGYSPQLHKSISMDTTSQGPRSPSSTRMTRTSSTAPLGGGPQPTGTQLESGLALGIGQMPANRQKHRPRFTSTLQSLLSNDFRCVVRCRAVRHNDCCTIIRRFRILVVGKVCIMYHTGRRRN